MRGKWCRNWWKIWGRFGVTSEGDLVSQLRGLPGWMHGCMDACMHACMYACMHVCIYACMHACMYACMHVCIYVCMHACMHAWMYVCMYVCIFFKDWYWYWSWYCYDGDARGINLPAESSKNGIARWQRAGCSSTERGAAFNDRLIACDKILISGWMTANLFPRQIGTG